MSEMSTGARAAWERWRPKDTDSAPVEMAAESFEEEQQRAFAAGYTAALASLEGYLIHAEEGAVQAEREGDELRWRGYNLAASNARNVRLWLTQGMTCGVASHKRCREQKR